MPSAIGMRRRVPSFGPLRCQRRPALVSPEHAAHRGGRNLPGLQPVRAVEGIVAAPVTGEDMLVDPLVAGIDPAFDRTGIHVGGQTKRLVSWLPSAHAVGIRTLPIGIEDAFVSPQAIEKRTSLGELRVLPRQDLRLRPVDVEDLRPSGFQRREVLVEIPLLDFALFVPVAFQVLAKLREPVPREADGEHSTNNRTSSLPDRLSRSFLDVAVSDVAILDLGHDRAPRGHILADLVGGAADMFPHVSVGSLQVIAPRRQTAFERHDPVANVDFSVRHGASLWLQSSVYWDRNARIGSTGAAMANCTSSGSPLWQSPRNDHPRASNFRAQRS